MGLEHGVTYGGSAGSAFALNGPIAGATPDALVKGYEIVLRSSLSYGAASRSVRGGSAAFEDASKHLVQNMMRSIAKKLEIRLLYGQMGLATVASTAANVITITTAEWAPGIWSGAKGMALEIRDTTGATLRGYANVASVSLSARTVTVDALPGGVVATDVIWEKGSYGNEMAGLHKIITNTGSLFGLSASDYELWAGNSYSASSGALSFAKIQKAIAKGVEKGLESSVLAVVNPSAWSDLLTEQAALRMYDQSYSSSELDNGSMSLKFHGQSGKIEIIPSIYVKEGYAYIMAEDDFMRIGSSDVTFKRPGQGDDNFFRELENNAGYELRCYSDQALFCHAPGHQVLINSVVNAA